MTETTLPEHLFETTRDLQERLNAAWGALDDLAGYRRYLAAMQAFRAGLEQAVASGPDVGWMMIDLSPVLRQDLADLRTTAILPVRAPVLSSPSAVAGALYVAESPGPAGRLFLRRAAALGYDGAYGARHLALHCADERRWPRFLAWLKRSGAERAEATTAARDVLMMALTAPDLSEKPARPRVRPAWI